MGLTHGHFFPGAQYAGVDLADAKSTPLSSFLLKEAGLGEALKAYWRWSLFFFQGAPKYLKKYYQTAIDI